MLSNSQACAARYFSLELYCIGNSDICDNPHDPFDESPYIDTVNASFFCSTGPICVNGNFFIEYGFGGGYWVSIGTLFYASWDGKVESLNIFGFWIDGVMFGFGKTYDGAFEHGYNFLFTGHKIPEFDY